MMTHAPLIFMDPFPRNEAMVYTPDCAEKLSQMGRIVAHWGSRAPDDLVEAHLAEMTVLIGQTAMPKERLDRAPNLRAILNVKANWTAKSRICPTKRRCLNVVNRDSDSRDRNWRSCWPTPKFRSIGN